MVKPLRIEKKQKWAEKPKLDNARRLRGIYFIDPDDEGYKEIFKNARSKFERPVAAASRAKDYPTASRKWLRNQRLHPKRIPKHCVVV